MSVQPKLLVLGLLLLLPNLIFAQNTKSIKVGEYSTTIKDKRLALVIGNNEYNEVSKLSNPVEDARAIKTALEACGFEVMTLENGTEKSIKEKVREFSEKLKTYDVGMFYYSGHGVELNGINYIVPTDIVLNATAADIAEECVATDFILKKMGEAGEVNKTYIMVLDACRNNPFKNIFKDLSAETWKQPTVVPSGSITCFAASQGEKAIEGHLHSPYTELFLKHINTPGLKIEDLFKRIRIDLIVLRKNNPQINQEPVEMNKLTTEFYFVPLNNKKPDPKPNEINSATARLKISSNSSGTLKIDGQNRGQIQKDEVLILELTAGEFILQFIPENGSPIKRNVSLSAGQSKVESFEVMVHDNDGDGIFNEKDNCPDEKGLSSTQGCPDKDFDGIPDKHDNCPDTYGIVTLKGCPNINSQDPKNSIDLQIIGYDYNDIGSKKLYKLTIKATSKDSKRVKCYFKAFCKSGNNIFESEQFWVDLLPNTSQTMNVGIGPINTENKFSFGTEKYDCTYIEN